MPLVSNTSIVVRQEVVTANFVKINGIYVDIPIDGGYPTIAIGVSFGMQAPDQPIKWVDHQRLTISDPGALNALVGGVTSGKTLYDEIKEKTYAYLKNSGLVPADSINT